MTDKKVNTEVSQSEAPVTKAETPAITGEETRDKVAGILEDTDAIKQLLPDWINYDYLANLLSGNIDITYDSFCAAGEVLRMIPSPSMADIHSSLCEEIKTKNIET